MFIFMLNNKQVASYVAMWAYMHVHAIYTILQLDTQQ